MDTFSPAEILSLSDFARLMSMKKGEMSLSNVCLSKNNQQKTMKESKCMCFETQGIERKKNSFDNKCIGVQCGERRI